MPAVWFAVTLTAGPLVLLPVGVGETVPPGGGVEPVWLVVDAPHPTATIRNVSAKNRFIRGASPMVRPRMLATRVPRNSVDVTRAVRPLERTAPGRRWDA